MNKKDSLKQDKIIKQTQKWLTSFIIPHNICPFAKRAFDKSSIYYDVVFEHDIEEQLQRLILACHELDENPKLETTLIIVPESLKDFDDYLDFLDIANRLMEKQNYLGIYQLASFHPDYCFDGVEVDDASNYTNRSPYPMLHLIREKSIERALLHFSEPENIPTRNIEYTRELGVDMLKKILSDCTN